MFNKIRKGSLLIYFGLTILNLFLLFILPSTENHGLHGHMVPWTIAIIMGIIAIVFILPPKKIKKIDCKKIIAYGTILLANIIMAIFSLIDIVSSENGNHALSTVIFVVVPLITIVVKTK